MRELTETVKEIRDRVVRLESRMVQLGDHVGANLRVRQKIDIHHQEDGGIWVEIDSLDVSLSRIYTELQQKGIATAGITICHHGRDVATLHGSLPATNI
jgi:hypothetical protein